MLENLQDAISGLEFEEVLLTVMFYYTLTFLIVGGLLLIVTLFRIYRLYQGQGVKTTYIIFLTTYFIVQLYLTIAIIVPYFQLVLTRMDDYSFWFPLDSLYQYSLKLQDTILFQLVGLVVIGGLILVSVVFLLSGLAKLLSSKPSRLLGGDNLMVSLIVSFVPVILFLGTL